MTEQYRIARAHSHGILAAFVSKMPTPTKWWPLPGDAVIKAMPAAEPGDTVLKGGDFVRAFGAAFGLN